MPELTPESAAFRSALDVVRSVESLGGLAYGLCHGDPAPEAFLRSEHGVGLIDWGSVVDGPLLYDVASAVMYLGGPAYAAPLLQAYEQAFRDGFDTTDTVSCWNAYQPTLSSWIPGDERNNKITYPDDLVDAERILRATGFQVQ